MTVNITKKLSFIVIALLIAVAMSGAVGLHFNLGSHQVHAQANSSVGKNAASQTAQNQYGGEIGDVDAKEDKSLYIVELHNSEKGHISVAVGESSGDIVDMQKIDEEEHEGAASNPTKGKMGESADTANNEGAASNPTKGKMGESADTANNEGAASNPTKGKMGESADTANNEGAASNPTKGKMGESADTANNDQEGGALPDTSSNAPLGLLIGGIVAMSGGALLAFRRKKKVTE
ncbi:hypothetical protein GCM10028778_21410 [Barrientosiimonas marina]|uniref:LPXTG cell wall anchor domain-containing protein n=1 Tax=Lentibacillus kimchii TaxID=1542911 RepID=A0ABW2UX51_9BACI